MSQVKNLFTVYDKPTLQARWIASSIWIILFCVIWVFNPITAIPTPVEIYNSFINLLYTEGSSNLLYNVWVTLKLQIYGLFYATIISAILAYISKLEFFNPLNKFIQILRYIPVVGFTLIFYSVFAIGFGMKVAMLSAGLVFFMTTSMTAVIENVPRLKYELAKSLGYSDWQIFVSVIFKPTLPLMIETVMQNAAMGWLMIVAVETFSRTEGGMGAMLQIYSSSSQTGNVWTYLIIIGFIALLEDLFFTQSRKYLFPYSIISERA